MQETGYLIHPDPETKQQREGTMRPQREGFQRYGWRQSPLLTTRVCTHTRPHSLPDTHLHESKGELSRSAQAEKLFDLSARISLKCGVEANPNISRSSDMMLGVKWICARVGDLCEASGGNHHDDCAVLSPAQL